VGVPAHDLRDNVRDPRPDRRRVAVGVVVPVVMRMITGHRASVRASPKQRDNSPKATCARDRPACEASGVATKRNARVGVTLLLLVVGVLSVVVAVLYFKDQAGALPSFFPGYSAHSVHKHTKHGIAALAVGVLSLAGAWLSTGKRRYP
jgi:hypothetical protein